MENDSYKQEIPLNILLVSTDKVILDIFEKVFRKYGHTTTVMSQPQDAIELVEANEVYDPFDIVFVDFDKYENLSRRVFCDTIKAINNRIEISDLGSAFIYKVRDVLEEHEKKQ